MNFIKMPFLFFFLVSLTVFAQNDCMQSFEEKYNTGQYQDAVEIAQTCPMINENVELRYFKARSLMYLTAYEAAIIDYRALLKTNIKNVDYLNGLGAAYYMLKQNDSALVYYSKTLTYDELHENALKNRCMLYFLDSEFELALTDVQTLLKIAPDNSNYWADLGDVYAGLGDSIQALEAYDKGLELDPENTTVYASIAEYYSFKENYEKAHFYAEQGLAINKADDLLYAIQGDAFYFQDDLHYKEALKAYLKSYKLKEDEEVSYFVGLCYDELNEPVKAAIYYKKAIELGSSDSDCYSNLAYLLYDSNPAEALDLLKTAIQLSPLDPYAYGIKGDLRYDSGDYEEAIEVYDLAIKHDTSYSYYIDRGWAYKALDKNEAAIADFTTSIEHGIYLEEAYYQRALLYLDEGDLDAANLDLNACIALNDQRADYFTTRAICKYRSGNIDAVCADMERAKDLGDAEAKKYYKAYCK